MHTLQLAKITKESIVDGPGLRMVLWAQGCSHHCEGCHNPSTHSYSGGQTYSIDDILTFYRANPLLQGITLSGGDPFEQAEGFAMLCKELKKSSSLDIWCYTGYTFEAILNEEPLKSFKRELLSQIDVLVDGPFVSSLKDLKLLFKGSSNQRILDIPQSLNKKSPVLWEDS